MVDFVGMSPRAWEAFRARVLARAGHRCEHGAGEDRCVATQGHEVVRDGVATRVVLTVEPRDRRALCQDHRPSLAVVRPQLDLFPAR